MSRENNICQFLEWDSNFFGVRIARLTCEFLTEEIVNLAFLWCRENNIECLFFLADSSGKKTIDLAEKNKFKLTDIRITLEKYLTDHSASDYQKNIASASHKDVSQLKQIASANHRDSRFYYDGNFLREKCDELFATWIEKSCEGFADIVLTAKTGDIVNGYITCSVDENRVGNIGLVGVNPVSQGKGVGKILITSALNWFAENKAEKITVVTQGRNVKAQRLYQKNGFVIDSLKLWYHFWFDQQ